MTGLRVGSLELEVEGRGAPILFLHGLGGTSNTFQPILGAFAGFRCLRPDLPGSGRSPRPYESLTLSAMVSGMIEILATVAGAPAHIVAHSMGTLVALHVAARAPDQVRSLVLFGPIPDPSDAMRQRLTERAHAARTDGMIAIADAAAAHGLSSASSDPLAAAFLRESHMRQDPEGFAQSCEALAGAEAADLRGLRLPLHAITGDEDAVAPPSVARALADKTRGRATIFDRCGHWTPIERPRECGRLAAEFIRAHD